jgi:hypothetical protein
MPFFLLPLSFLLWEMETSWMEIFSPPSSAWQGEGWWFSLFFKRLSFAQSLIQSLYFCCHDNWWSCRFLSKMSLRFFFFLLGCNETSVQWTTGRERERERENLKIPFSGCHVANERFVMLLQDLMSPLSTALLLTLMLLLGKRERKKYYTKLLIFINSFAKWKRWHSRQRDIIHHQSIFFTDSPQTHNEASQERCFSGNSVFTTTIFWDCKQRWDEKMGRSLCRLIFCLIDKTDERWIFFQCLFNSRRRDIRFGDTILSSWLWVFRSFAFKIRNE